MKNYIPLLVVTLTAGHVYADDAATHEARPTSQDDQVSYWQDHPVRYWPDHDDINMRACAESKNGCGKDQVVRMYPGEPVEAKYGPGKQLVCVCKNKAATQSGHIDISLPLIGLE